MQLGTEFMSDEKSLWLLEKRILLCPNVPQYDAKVRAVDIQTGKNTQQAPYLCFYWLVAIKAAVQLSQLQNKIA